MKGIRIGIVFAAMLALLSSISFVGLVMAEDESTSRSVRMAPGDLPEGDYQSAGQALKEAQLPMGPAAARAYIEAEERRKYDEKVKKGVSGLLEEIFHAAGENGVTREAIQTFVDMNSEPDEYAGKHFLVFVSSSLPQEMLKNLMRVMGTNGSTAFVLRGLVGNDIQKIKPTQEWVRSFMCSEENDECYEAPVDINPVLFDKLNVERVPAIAYVPEPSTFLSSCEGEAPGDDDFLLYYGDFSPLHALEVFTAARPDDARLAALVKDISRKGFHQDSGR